MLVMNIFESMEAACTLSKLSNTEMLPIHLSMYEHKQCPFRRLLEQPSLLFETSPSQQEAR